jgi:hypothetical protein
MVRPGATYVPRFRVYIEASKLLMTGEDGTITSGGFFQTLWVDAAGESEARKRAVSHVKRMLREDPGFIRNPLDAVLEIHEIGVSDDERDDLETAGRAYYPDDDE